MNTEKILFYVAIVGILSLTMLMTYCNYSTSQCKIEAIKAGIAPEKIATLCHMR